MAATLLPLAGALAFVLTCSMATAEGEAKAQPAKPERLVKRAADVEHDAAMRSDHVRRLLMRARLSENLIASRCLDDKLSQSHAVERQAGAQRAAIAAAVAAGQPQEAEARAAQLEAYEARSRLLLLQATECGGVSKRVRMPTRYQVRLIAPRLPPERQVERGRQGEHAVRPRVR